MIRNKFFSYLKTTPRFEDARRRFNFGLELSLEALYLATIRLKSTQEFKGNIGSNVVVSLTSFPARIANAWIPIETMFQQDFRPWKVVLVLDEGEFPKKTLPRPIREQQDRGLEILWTHENMRSYKKLLPTRQVYPDAHIVTIDDDIFYEPWRLSRLMQGSLQHPGSIVGLRGRKVSFQEDGKLKAYKTWPLISNEMVSPKALLGSGAGLLFPPNVLPDDLLLDFNLARKLCPTADDIWFWAVAVASGVPVTCLGVHHVRFIVRQRKTPALSDVNWRVGANDIQIERVLDYFDLWGEVH
jgi:hypothetical protein